MKKTLALSLLLVLVAAGTVYATDTDTDTEAARIYLKKHGLVYCIAKQFPERSDMRKDLGLAMGSYHFMGTGMHRIIQNEDTLETLHDPYKATNNYILSVYDDFRAGHKFTKKKIVFHACLQIYNSKEFNDFIESQDQYIDPASRSAAGMIPAIQTPQSAKPLLLTANY